MLSVTTIFSLVIASTFALAQPSATSSGRVANQAASRESYQYDVSLFPGNGETGSPQGEVTITKQDVTTIQVNQASPNTTYTVDFCPAPQQLYPTCLSVGSVTSNGSGVIDGTIAFPSGSWAGDFQLFANSSLQYSTSLIYGTPSTYYATLQLGSTVNGKGIWFQHGQKPPQDPLKFGYVTYPEKNGHIKVNIQGASPNTGYYAAQCPLFESNCQTVQKKNGGPFEFFTNAKGNATFSGTVTNMGMDIFYVDNYSTGFDYIAGFSIP